MPATLWKRRVVEPLRALLTQGVAPERLALSLAVGAVVGVVPVLGTTTILCTVIALASRLNLVAIQVSNWLVYPLQLVLLLPFFRAGAWLFGAPQPVLAPAELIRLFRDDVAGTLVTLWDASWHAVVAWLVLGIPAAILLRRVLIPVVRGFSKRYPMHEATA